MLRRFLLLALGLATAGCERPPAPSGQARPNDPEARARLLERIGDINDFDRPRPLVTLEEFFEGNHDWGSIGYNISDSPPPQEWYRLLLEIRARPEVHDVLIEVKDLEDPDDWPSTDTIWVITSANADEVASWLPENLAPDETLDGFEDSLQPVEPYEVPPDHRAVGLWYD